MNTVKNRKKTPPPVKGVANAAGIDRESPSNKPFVKRNFIYMGISLAMIIGGFLLMTGSANNDPATFNADIFSVRRIVIGPGIAFLGFVAMALSILYTPRKQD